MGSPTNLFFEVQNFLLLKKLGISQKVYYENTSSSHGRNFRCICKAYFYFHLLHPRPSPQFHCCCICFCCYFCCFCCYFCCCGFPENLPVIRRPYAEICRCQILGFYSSIRICTLADGGNDKCQTLKIDSSIRFCIEFSYGLVHVHFQRSFAYDSLSLS